MTSDQLKEKYGNEKVMGIDRSIAKDVLRDGFTCRLDAMTMLGDAVFPLGSVISHTMYPRLRCEAEKDQSFLQIIPYAAIENTKTGMYFVMERTGGDERLLHQVSLGVGGHVEPGEAILDGLYREIYEEIGLNRDDFTDHQFCGYLCGGETEVDQVHLGMVYRLYTEREDIQSLEPDKFEGFWASMEELQALRTEGRLESWSALTYDCVLNPDKE